MKILFFSDIHGSATRAAQAAKIVTKENPDKIILLGDLLYHGARNALPSGYETRDVATILNTLSDKIIAVRGNCDSEVDQVVLDFPMQGDATQVFDGKRQIFATHGHIYSPNDLPRGLNKGDIFASGHTHIPLLQVNKDDVILFNPGSTTIPRGGSSPSYGIYTKDKIVIRGLENDSMIMQLDI